MINKVNFTLFFVEIKLDIGYILTLVHDAATIRTKEYAGEQACFVIAVGASALLAQRLHPFPCVMVYDRLVVVLKDCLLFGGVLLALLYLVGHFLGSEVHKAARVFPVFKDMRHGVCRPSALIAGVVAAGASRPAVVQRFRRGDLLLDEIRAMRKKTGNLFLISCLGVPL